ncbi:MAG TPA: hypothetical protein VHD61_00045 [Lacunisphaera sp.]|nr:hypothetical protein [Lacunisphaera sp.]
MKYPALFLLLGVLACSAEEVTLTKSAMLRGEKSATSLKAGTVVELISRDEKTLTVRYRNQTGTIPAGSIDAATAEAPKKEEAKPDKPPPPPRKAETTYGKAVEKARDSAAKHEKDLVKPADEVTGK